MKMRMDYSSTIKTNNMKFDVKYSIGIPPIPQNKMQFYVGVQSRIGNIQSDVKGCGTLIL
jgi:hypothetical protein